MATSQQKVYLITEAQREALLSYLQERPYKEVAAGIQFLMNAPTATLNITSPDEETASESSTDNEVTPIAPPSLGEPVPPPSSPKAKEKLSEQLTPVVAK